MADTEVPFLAEAPLAGVTDYCGRPVYRNTSGGWRSALFVVVVEVASTFAFYGVLANLITYLTGPLGHSNAAAAAAVNAWSGTASLMPLLGAFVADSWLGRYRSIILACTLYVLGYGMITLASMLQVQGSWQLDRSSSNPSSLQVAVFYASLYLVALAQADPPCRHHPRMVPLSIRGFSKDADFASSISLASAAGAELPFGQGRAAALP